jgi:hypothetical protein
MKKKKRIILSTFLLVLITMFSTDFIRSKSDQSPVFAILTGTYDDGGSKRFTGIFYTVYQVKELTEEYGVRDYGYHVTFWFDDLDRIKEVVLNED